MNERVSIPSLENDMKWQKRQARTRGVGCLSIATLLFVEAILCVAHLI